MYLNSVKSGIVEVERGGITTVMIAPFLNDLSVIIAAAT